jgi:malate dehydrogenase
VFIPRVARRGAEIIEVRGSSSVASAANAAIEHVRDDRLGTGAEWTSAAVVSRGEYDVPEGLVCSFPVTSDGTGYRVVEGLELDRRGRGLFDASVAELAAERQAVRELGLV